MCVRLPVCTKKDNGIVRRVKHEIDRVNECIIEYCWRHLARIVLNENAGWELNL